MLHQIRSNIKRSWMSTLNAKISIYTFSAFQYTNSIINNNIDTQRVGV
jgi:hypothetical protein